MRELFVLGAISTQLGVAAPSSLAVQKKTDDVAAAMVRLEPQWASGAGKARRATAPKFDRHKRWTDAWMKMPNGRWQGVAGPRSEVKK